jgi:hypothetical protein
VFLDSSTVQTLFRYGGAIFAGDEVTMGDRAHAIPGFAEDLRALERIFAVNTRAGVEFAVSLNGMREIAAKGEPRYTQWALHPREHWLISAEEYGGVAFDGVGELLARRLEERSFSYLSTKDRLLLKDALLFECGAVLTMVHRLARNASHIDRETGLMVLRPPDYWSLMAPWAGLYL